jgi:hypothetical protein
MTLPASARLSPHTGARFAVPAHQPMICSLNTAPAWYNSRFFANPLAIGITASRQRHQPYYPER